MVDQRVSWHPLTNTRHPSSLTLSKITLPSPPPGLQYSCSRSTPTGNDSSHSTSHTCGAKTGSSASLTSKRLRKTEMV
ncbi:hypothetical protein VIGAN_01457500 [Vigna angularis var. angularis]|nr:hypothetical protein VIGAN_01457500 [Vigna angularis var. angularis]